MPIPSLNSKTNLNHQQTKTLPTNSADHVPKQSLTSPPHFWTTTRHEEQAINNTLTKIINWLADIQ